MLSSDFIELIKELTKDYGSNGCMELTDKQVKIFYKKISNLVDVNPDDISIITLYACVFYVIIDAFTKKQRYNNVLNQYHHLDFSIGRAVSCITGANVEQFKICLSPLLENDLINVEESIKRYKSANIYNLGFSACCK